MELVRIENEENAILCMKTIMDFQRHQVRVLADRVQPFLNLIQEMFRKVEGAVKETFDNPSQGSAPVVPPTPSNPANFQSPRPGSPMASISDLGMEQQSTCSLPKGMQSFKVLAECPIIVVSLFQAHRTFVSTNVKQFVPLIKGVLLLQAKPQEQAHAEAKREGKVFTDVSPQIKNRVAYGEFITAQVKTMSFLAYLLRVYAQQLEDFLPTLPEIVVRLLKDCPKERSATRKELLVAIRHIINYNFRKIFLNKIDDLLDERILIGDALTVYETMRPLAYSMLADLIHHVREDLKKHQIRRTVEVYTRNLHDDFPGTSFQTMSARLLLNMADCIANKLDDKRDARHFLMMILDAIGDKFATMNRQFDNAKKVRKRYRAQSIDAPAEDYLPEEGDPPDWDEVDIFNATPIKTSNPRERGADPVADNKFLFKNLMNGLKNLFYQLKICNPDQPPVDPANTPSNWQEVSYGYDAEEVKVITKLFREGARMFRYYGIDKPSHKTPYSSPVEFLSNHYTVSSGKEEKDLLETFATVFHCIDAATFYEVFHSEIPHLYDMMFDQTALLHIPQFFLASEVTSPSFAGMLLQFLMDHLEDVGSSDVKKSSILLKLFKLSFMAVTLFSVQNEQVLLPHVTKILTKSIQLSANAEEPINYFLLLRSLFRSIGGGRFELLYKEILPLLEMMLDVLNSLLIAARKPQERDLYVELCLTVPARLSNLLPHLSYLMRPLVIALGASLDLVPQGLRTLELCVDNLTADYLDPIMAPVMQELMTALWSHLRPMPYSHIHSHMTMRILGKLGGRNRKFLNGPPVVEYRSYADQPSSIEFKLIGSGKGQAFPTDIGIDLAIGKLMEPPKGAAAKISDRFYQQQAFRLVSSQVKLYIGLDNLPDDFAQLVRLQANDLVEANYDYGPDTIEKFDRHRSIIKKDHQEKALKQLLKACISAVSVADLRDEASTLVADVCRHFTLIELGRALAQMKHGQKPFDVSAGEGVLYLDCAVLAEVISESLSSGFPEVRTAAGDAMQVVRDSAVVIFGSEDRVSHLPFFGHLGRTFCHNCHEEDWSTKGGGSLGIHLLATKIDLGDTWLSERQVEFIKSLMYVIKDLPLDLPSSTRIQAQNTMEALLRRCNKHSSRADLGTPSSKLSGVCGYLVYELAHMNKHVRDTSQRAFQIIAEVIGAEVSELLSPVKERLLSHIYNKPLRALPFATQIGYIDAMSFCLDLQHGIVEFNDQSNRLLLESLALADAEDENLAAKPSEQRTAELIVNLRVSCIRLLSIALRFPEFGNAPQNQSRSRIISVFFKLLYSKSSAVIEAANSALKKILIQHNKLPKQLLQNGLRPILMNLQDFRRLTIPGLDGLARLLALLTNYFKVEIGAMLLGHMEAIADANMLQRISFTLVEQNHQMKLIAAILNIFHLLPPAANAFMNDVVNKVLDLEKKLRRTHFSPFRDPLVRYLNRYPQEAWAYFSSRIHDLMYGRLFAQVLTHNFSGPLRQVIMDDVEGMLKASLDLPNEVDRYTAAVNTIHVVHSIVQQPGNSNWLVTQENFRLRLAAAGKELEGKLKQDRLPTQLRLAVQQAGEQLMAIYTISMASTPYNLELLFEVIHAVTTGELRSYYSLTKYIYDYIITSDSIEFWRTILMRCLDLAAGRTITHRLKAFAFHYLVNPIIARDIMCSYQKTNSAEGSLLMDKIVAEAIHSKIWKAYLTDFNEDTSQPGVDHSRLEILQLSAMLIKYHHKLIMDVRKDIIKFGWVSIKLEDILNKQAAYVVIAYFIANYDSPPKIVNQVYVALLRAYQNEGRSLVTQALDLIASVLPKRVSNAGDSRGISWARWPRRILMEESSNLQQCMSIFHFLIRHPDLFYESREQFIPSIIQSLSKIAPGPTSSVESKRVAINLIGLVWKWEERRVAEPSFGVEAVHGLPESQKRRLDGLHGGYASPSTVATASDRAEYVIPATLRMVLVKYLVSYITSTPDRYPIPQTLSKDASSDDVNVLPQPTREMVKKTLQVLYDLLSPSFWADLDVDLFPKITESILASDKTDNPDERMTTHIINTLQVVCIIVNWKSNEWINTQLPQLQRLLEKPLRSEDVQIQDCLHGTGYLQVETANPKSLLQCILDAVPEEEHDEEDPDSELPPSEFISFLSATANETLSSSNYISSVNILSTLSKRKPSAIDRHIPALMKALSHKLAKDCLPATNTTSLQSGVSQPIKPSDAVISAREQEDVGVQIDLVLKTVDIIALRMSVLGEQRRPFLIVLASLVEKSQHSKICFKVLDMVETWVFASAEAFPTLKEKTAVLHKMLAFESRADPSLLTKFLDLVIRIYEDPMITRTELTVRLEHAFLIGTRAQDVELRNRFMSIFDRSLTRTARARLSYVMTSQNWDTLADSFWLSQAAQLIFGSVEQGSPVQLHPDDFTVPPASIIFGVYAKDSRKEDLLLEDRFVDFIDKHKRFCRDFLNIKARDILDPICHLQYLDPRLSHEVWLHLFPICWSSLSRDDRGEMERGMVSMLTKEYHQRQVDKRPNVVQTLLEGAAKAKPTFKIPPHVLKFLSQTYDVWYTVLSKLEEAAMEPIIDTARVRESNLDALIELYATLQEDDLFYGVWRRRCQFIETNAALSYEQQGMWDKALQLYDAAQIKTRTGSIPCSEAEYMLWEDHWVICAQKLQQWEILFDLAKHGNYNDMLLEGAWRQNDLWHNPEQREWLDSIIKGVMDAPTPRRSFFQAFMSLLKLHADPDNNAAEFHRNVDEAIQLSIRKWHQLPQNITNAHIPILQNFQQLVEMHDASVICTSLSQTTPQNLDSKSQELKLLLSTWRDRLPNIWDDINAWQDLVAWRQHIFHMINNIYLTLIPQQGAGAAGNSYAYRGYHETAWIINRFAHVARKHQLPEVCISQLGRIYTLPNIEIQEAFLKLREQAKCHYQNPAELNSGLDVINNTNLNYFGNQQKAEFFTLKGMFLAKLNHKEEANEAFGTALYHDIKLPKAWAEWGHYNDNNFKANPTDLSHATSAVSCYLEAAGLFKNAKSRKLLGRILWLLSLDNDQGAIAAAFDSYNGDTPVWYWITFLPQLLSSLSHKEAPLSKTILVKVAKVYPQVSFLWLCHIGPSLPWKALYFLLRTSREDMAAAKKQQEQSERNRVRQGSPSAKQGSPPSRGPTSSALSTDGGVSRSAMTDGENGPNGIKEEKGKFTSPTIMLPFSMFANVPFCAGVSQAESNGQSHSSPIGNPQQSQQQSSKRHPLEYTEEIMSVLKTAFPLLALSMETMVDQIQKHFKCPPDEDAYRLIVALLNDGLAVGGRHLQLLCPLLTNCSQYVGRTPSSYAQDNKLPQPTEANITRFAEKILPAHIRKSFEADFVLKKPTMPEYIHKLRRWRDKFEEKLDRRPSHQNLEQFSPHLSDFRFQKFDEVEVPGQYLQLKDKHQDFIRIERFLPNVDLVRGIGVCHRRLNIRGHDGSIHAFAVQHPAARHCRREERIVQLFRIFNSVLARKKESRRRNLSFHLPLMIPLAPHIRLVQDDASYISLQGIFEDHCRRTGINKDEPILFMMEKLRVLSEAKPAVCSFSRPDCIILTDLKQKFVDQSANLRVEAVAAIQEKIVAPTVALQYLQSTHSSFSSFWLFRRQFSYQLSALTFMTYIMHMNNRYPHKLSISRKTGNIWGSELIPALASGKPFFHNPEPVPFRLTPNLQMLMGPIAAEGIFSCAIMSIARCLTEPEFDLEANLSIFVRDEMSFWFSQNRSVNQDNQMREIVQANSETIVKKAVSLAQPAIGNLPVHQTVIDLVARAVNPYNLAQTDTLWMPYL